MIIPTSAVTMGVLSLADIPYEKWLKWMLPLICDLVCAGAFASHSAILFWLGLVKTILEI
jgi:uncharacterized ion transporter superfamily protein YfcC